MILLAVIALFVILAIIANTGNGHGTFLEKLVIHDDFGSNRGYIWKRYLDIFSNASLKDKIFGAGPAAACGAAVMVSYLFQGCVNNPTIFVTPLLFVYAGILVGKCIRFK